MKTFWKSQILKFWKIKIWNPQSPKISGFSWVSVFQIFDFPDFQNFKMWDFSKMYPKCCQLWYHLTFSLLNRFWIFLMFQKALDLYFHTIVLIFREGSTNVPQTFGSVFRRFWCFVLGFSKIGRSGHAEIIRYLENSQNLPDQNLTSVRYMSEVEALKFWSELEVAREASLTFPLIRCWSGTAYWRSGINIYIHI